MKIKGKRITFNQIFFLSLYYGIFYHLPGSGFPIFGRTFKKLRYICGKKLFKYCGKNVNIERKAFFASGEELEIGDYSGLGKNCTVPSNLKIGKYVMMGPNCHIFDANHKFEYTNQPMMFQGWHDKPTTRIEDDVWIGRNVIITPGRYISKGSIIAAGCVLSKDFPEYSIVGGNPSRLLKSRINNIK
jgi:maltose O-acetyltransferase